MYLDIPNLLNLSIVPGVGSMRLRALIAKFRSAEDVFKASIKEITSINGIEFKTAQSIKNFNNFTYGEIQHKRAQKLGVKITTFWDEEYPANLKRINDPPVLLFTRGNLLEQDRNAISIVGTRSPSNYGKIISEKITAELARKGITVVSGLARGIDTIAHLEAIKASGRTIAVIGTGIDIIYPPENKSLIQQIVDNGAVVSEFPLGTPPDAVNFPRRNRIIAGLSLGTVITEAGEKSGALITANLALEYNREVFAVPGNITNARSKGCNQLIKEGAKLVTSVDDILEELMPYFGKLLLQQKSINTLKDINSQEKAVLNNLSESPIHIDELARKMNLPPGDLLSKLLSLEFKDLVKQLPGKLFVRTF